MTFQVGPTRIAISGHQVRPGIDWEWTELEIRKVFERHMPIERAFTSLAIGSDQVFARQALALGVPVTAVLPLPEYERFFKGDNLLAYKALLSRCDLVVLTGSGNEQQSFFEAGRHVADSAELLIAVWDGKPAVGLGGTADIVRHCVDSGRPVVHINPITRTVRTIEPLTEGL